MSRLNERTFRTHDTTLIVSTRVDRIDRVGLPSPDWETANRLKDTLAALGFAFSPDPKIVEHYPILSKYHRLGERPTPAGPIFVHWETYPTGCKIEFYQELVTINRHGGRYDFDKRTKMPYLIGKAFELAVGACKQHLIARGFTSDERVTSPNPDPLAHFNAIWGDHRMPRDETGWPEAKALSLSCWGVDAEHPLLEQGAVRYFRDHRGHLMRGRCYGGVNGMWTVVYGPGPRDYTQRHCRQLFVCNPALTPRRVFPDPKGRVKSLLKAAVERQDYEVAIPLRDTLARIEPTIAEAA